MDKCHCKHLNEYAPVANIPTTCGIKEEFDQAECNAGCSDYEESEAFKKLLGYGLLGSFFGPNLRGRGR